MATDDDTHEAIVHEWRPPPAPPLPAGGPLGETAVTRALTPAEDQQVAQARTARGEEPYPTITPEHRARLEADRAAAVRAEALIPPVAPEWLGWALRASPLPAGTRAECEVLPSGAVDLVIRYDEHVVVMQGSADRRQWGYSLGPAGDEGLMGHDEVAPLLPVALHAVAALLGGCDPPSSPVRLPVRPGVAGILDALHEQRITLAAAAADFAARDWSMPSMAMFEQEEPARANHWQDVEAARQTGRITLERYRVLDDSRGVVIWHQAPDEPR